MIWRIPVVTLIIILSLFLDCRGENSCVEKSENKSGVNSATDKNFEKSLGNALEYLASVCGEDGTKKMIILKNGETVFDGGESEFMQKVWSCTKSFTSTVLGLLIEDGKCKLDDKVYIYLPELKEYYPEVTFRHFATMTSGYKAQGNDKRSGHGQSATPFLPSPEPNSAPGEEFLYWDSAMNMFTLALTKVAGEPLMVYFKQKVADRIGLDTGKWDWKDFGPVDGVGISGGAGNKGGIYIAATEMAKFGQLFLNNGKWDNRQIVPEKWITESTSPQIKNIIPGDDTPYGFNWWTSGTFPDAPKKTFAALGYNNNKCIVIPEWNMVIVRLGLDGNIDNEKWNEFINILAEVFED